mmetsp:Transcript_466/g.856  ORF Transcript_466/g.856 Transcript_466/m.856 type:complete len:205 (-) Transcript_466:610-1224(-)
MLNDEGDLGGPVAHAERPGYGDEAEDDPSDGGHEDSDELLRHAPVRETLLDPFVHLPEQTQEDEDHDSNDAGEHAEADGREEVPLVVVGERVEGDRDRGGVQVGVGGEAVEDDKACAGCNSREAILLHVIVLREFGVLRALHKARHVAGHCGVEPGVPGPARDAQLVKEQNGKDRGGEQGSHRPGHASKRGYGLPPIGLVPHIA